MPSAAPHQPEMECAPAQAAGACPPVAAESSGADLAEWRPVSYRGYFEASELRRASDALAAYDALPADRRAAFEKLVAAMDALATMAVFALQPPYEKETAPIIAEAT